MGQKPEECGGNIPMTHVSILRSKSLQGAQGLIGTRMTSDNEEKTRIVDNFYIDILSKMKGCFFLLLKCPKL